MNTLITIGVVIVSLIALVLLIALFVKQRYSLYREITINRSKEQVFQFIKYLKNQDHYAVWNQMDPAMKRAFTGTDGTVGFKSAWDSQNKKVGKGEQEIKKITENERLDTALHFIKPFEGLADSWMTTTGTGNGTTVQWGLSSKMKYPMNIMLLFMNMDKLLGSDLEKGLANLKTVLEKT